ncbi:MAG TPA: hypothetical protein VNN55_10715, partial [bacterium]|nr:hypothetical protein [bacterium]
FYPLKPEDGINRRWCIIASKSGYAPETVKVDVVTNVLLGTEHNEYDALIIQKCAQYGVPPPIVKAQIWRESGFNPNGYAYEPYTFDYVAISIGAEWREGNPAIDEYPYYEYSIAIPSGWPNGPRLQGRLLNPEDIDFRNRYNLSDNSPPDGVLSAQELVWNNPGQGSSWHYADFPIVPFVAQTTIAASYGLLQIWWATALSPMNWNRGAAGRPSELMDPPVNIALSSGYLRLRLGQFMAVHPDSGWDASIRTALVWYNKGRRPCTACPDYTHEDGDYDERVIAEVWRCMPSQ